MVLYKEGEDPYSSYSLATAPHELVNLPDYYRVYAGEFADFPSIEEALHESDALFTRWLLFRYAHIPWDFQEEIETRTAAAGQSSLTIRHPLCGITIPENLAALQAANHPDLNAIIEREGLPLAFKNVTIFYPTGERDDWDNRIHQPVLYSGIFTKVDDGIRKQLAASLKLSKTSYKNSIINPFRDQPDFQNEWCKWTFGTVAGLVKPMMEPAYATMPICIKLPTPEELEQIMFYLISPFESHLTRTRTFMPVLDWYLTTICHYNSTPLPAHTFYLPQLLST